jgi:lipopolysaccharide transport system permease protein
MLGILWPLLTPILMLSVYTFVFSVVFKARWAVDGDESKSQFAIVLFVGMIIHGFIAEALNSAPNLIVGHTNYVKKVIFPLEILSIVSIGTTLFHTLVSMCVLFAAALILNGHVPWTAVFTPLILLPLVVLGLGLSWLLASLGVFIRDISQTVTLLTTVLLFLSPVFFPVSALPEQYRIFVMANPLTFIIEQARAVVIWGHMPNWSGLGIYTAISATVAWAGYAWFQKTRKGFSDVL